MWMMILITSSAGEGAGPPPKQSTKPNIRVLRTHLVSKSLSALVLVRLVVSQKRLLQLLPLPPSQFGYMIDPVTLAPLFFFFFFFQFFGPFGWIICITWVPTCQKPKKSRFSSHPTSKTPLLCFNLAAWPGRLARDLKKRV